MTTQSIKPAGSGPQDVGSSFSTSSIFRTWRSNPALILAAITLVALVFGWIGQAIGLLPDWAITIAAVTAYVAGGYTGMKGAIEEAREGTLDIDFLMIAAALGAALIGAWPEGALLLFLFTLSGALEEFAMDRTRAAIEALADLRPDVARVRQEWDRGRYAGRAGQHRRHRAGAARRTAAIGRRGRQRVQQHRSEPDHRRERAGSQSGRR